MTDEDFLATAPDVNITVEVIDLYGKEKIKKQRRLWCFSGQPETWLLRAKVYYYNRLQQ